MSTNTAAESMEELARAARKASRDQKSAAARLESYVQQMRSHGASWAYIGAVCGTSKSAAFQRFARRELR